ncbi:MAG: 3-hydroxyacyl-CoA dehydrogenase NAD-binding domain-containing protein [Promethearchaeota archaeon]
MYIDDITSILVIGAGDMGHGIAEVFAMNGWANSKVFLKDVKSEILNQAIQRIRESLFKLVNKKRIEKNQVDQIINRIMPILDYNDSARLSQIAIEAVPEIMDLKKKVFEELDSLLDPRAIIATNTSNMSITDLASVTKRPENVVGMHFFNPVVVMKTVEIVRGKNTSDETMQLASKIVERIGKIAIQVEKDVPGFVVNRILAAANVLLNKVVELGIARPNQVDALARKMAQPMGPFELMDYVGLDVVKHSANYFHERLGDDFKAPQWLVELVERGHLGKKTGRGIYDWSNGRPNIDLNDFTDQISMLDLIVVQINEASKLIEQGVVRDPDDIELAIINGTGNKSGIFGILKSDRQMVIDRLSELAERFGVKIFKPNSLLESMEIPSYRRAIRKRKREKKGL